MGETGIDMSYSFCSISSTPVEFRPEILEPKTRGWGLLYDPKHARQETVGVHRGGERLGLVCKNIRL
jgi:hypothetical protein